MEIRNIYGTSQNVCKCGSWLQHWVNFSKQSVPNNCPVIGCDGKDLEGAHVQNDDYRDKNWYIYPLCVTHNAAKGRTLEVSDNYRLVSANISKTCG